MIPAEPPADARSWDVVVIGTGLGGSTIGGELARAGYSVLFLEKGRDVDGAAPAAGDHVEDAARRLDAGCWPDRMRTRIDGEDATPFPALGCGVGGSSLLYAAALERFERSDIEAVPGLAHPTGGWPVGWREMCRYYARAERLFRVVGTRDPLSPDDEDALPQPPPASAIDEAMIAAFAGAGLHPYRLHVGLGYVDGCMECGGRVCPRRCKSDARSICLEPALRHRHVTLLSGSEVVSIEADRARATGVTYRRHGVMRRARGRIVILAAGAYRSPALLLASRNATWPDGLANGSGLVGRNLMFHANEWFAVWPPRRLSERGPRKTIGLRDLYSVDGARLGSIQSTGLSADAGNIYGYLRMWFDRSALRRITPLRRGLWIVAKLAERVFGTATIFVMIVEDIGHAGNRVVEDPSRPDRIAIEYDIPNELRVRAATARRLVRERLRGLRVRSLQSDVQLNLGHACGTCRFGTDPATSVLDPNCKAHELDNLYVVDGSFMPTSGGANPGLTIVANALRVADAVRHRLAAATPAGAVAEAAS